MPGLGRISENCAQRELDNGLEGYLNSDLQVTTMLA